MRTTIARWALISAVLVIGLTLLAQVELWLLWMPDPDEANGAVPLGVRAAAALAAAPLTLSLGLGRRLPVLSLGLAIPAVALLPAGPLETSVALVLAIGLASFRAALFAKGVSELGIGVVAIAGIVATTSVVHPGTVEEIGDLALLLLVLGAPWVAGLAIGRRRDREAELESNAARAEAGRRAEAAAAVADERARIARELHDVVAHAISVIVLQARGGRRSIGRDPGAAAQALDEIETTGTRALAEMRRLVGVLRPGDEAGGLEPPPGLAQLDALVAGVNDTGLAVDVQSEGSPVELAPGLDLAAYRLVQEALTNTLRHAGAGAAHVILRYLPGSIEIEVVDEGAPIAPDRVDPGHGMTGMRERVSLYGGTVEFGPRVGGGFRVVARLPLGGDPA